MDKKRLLSIDTLRGMDMLLIMGLSSLIVTDRISGSPGR